MPRLERHDHKLLSNFERSWGSCLLMICWCFPFWHLTAVRRDAMDAECVTKWNGICQGGFMLLVPSVWTETEITKEYLTHLSCSPEKPWKLEPINPASQIFHAFKVGILKSAAVTWCETIKIHLNRCFSHVPTIGQPLTNHFICFHMWPCPGSKDSPSLCSLGRSPPLRMALEIGVGRW